MLTVPGWYWVRLDGKAPRFSNSLIANEPVDDRGIQERRTEESFNAHRILESNI